MRLIDADAFADFIAETSKRQGYDKVELGSTLTVADVLNEVIAELKGEGIDGFSNAPTIEPEREWIPCSNPPKHHRDVLVRGTELIGYRTVHKVMQWDVDTWRPTDYAPSIRWEEWSEI